jgi:O-antigen ligase
VTSHLPLPSRPGLLVKQSESLSATDSFVFYGVFGLLLLGPLAFGGVEPWAIFSLEAGAGVLFVVWVASRFSSSELSIGWSALFAPMLLFAALVAFQIATRKTAYRYATFSSSLLYGAYGLLCFLTVQCLRRSSQVKILAISLSAYGMAVATFSLFQGLASNGKLYWLRTPAGASWIYGPYVNHNHYAGLMEMLFPIPLVFSLTTYARGGLRKAAVLASAVMATTIFLSGSRGGMVAFMCELIVLACVLIWQRGSERSLFSSKLILALFAILFLSLLGWIGGHEAIDRLINVQSGRHEITAGLRLAIDRDLLKMFPHRPFLGWGLGTFEYVYPQFRSLYTSYHIDEAHNDYLQLLIELGAAGFITMIWFLSLVFRIGSKKLKNWPQDSNGAVALAALLGITGILVHSLVDFNLQVPANAAMFYVYCVIAAMEPRFGSFHPPRLD